MSAEAITTLNKTQPPRLMRRADREEISKHSKQTVASQRQRKRSEKQKCFPGRFPLVSFSKSFTDESKKDYMVKDPLV